MSRLTFATTAWFLLAAACTAGAPGALVGVVDAADHGGHNLDAEPSTDVATNDAGAGDAARGDTENSDGTVETQGDLGPSTPWGEPITETTLGPQSTIIASSEDHMRLLVGEFHAPDVVALGQSPGRLIAVDVVAWRFVVVSEHALLPLDPTKSHVRLSPSGQSAVWFPAPSGYGDAEGFHAQAFDFVKGSFWRHFDWASSTSSPIAAVHTHPFPNLDFLADGEAVYFVGGDHRAWLRRSSGAIESYPMDDVFTDGADLYVLQAGVVSRLTDAGLDVVFQFPSTSEVLKVGPGFIAVRDQAGAFSLADLRSGEHWTDFGASAPDVFVTGGKLHDDRRRVLLFGGTINGSLVWVDLRGEEPVVVEVDAAANHLDYRFAAGETVLFQTADAPWSRYDHFAWGPKTGVARLSDDACSGFNTDATGRHLALFDGACSTYLAKPFTRWDLEATGVAQVGFATSEWRAHWLGEWLIFHETTANYGASPGVPSLLMAVNAGSDETVVISDQAFRYETTSPGAETAVFRSEDPEYFGLGIWQPRMTELEVLSDVPDVTQIGDVVASAQYIVFTARNSDDRWELRRLALP